MRVDNDSHIYDHNFFKSYYYDYERQISILQPLDRDLCDCHRDLSLRSAIPAFQQAVQ